ncbi:MAG TPA: glycosyltransferase family 87 protein [Phycisphaerae bacterium]|nr:glycosyltransferase family 87 protein [Phycisphaerae bacterium]
MHWARSILGTVAVLLVLRFCLSATYGSALATMKDGFTDFPRMYLAGQRLNNHQPLYTHNLTDWYPPDLYIYPPTLGIAAQFMARFSELQTRYFWVCLMLATMTLAVFVFASAAGFKWFDAIPFVVLLVTEHRFIPTMWQFFFGQVEFPLLLILVGMYWAISRRNPALFACVVSCGILIKTWMAIGLLWLIVTRAWRWLGFSLLLTFGGLALMFTYLGWQEFPWFVGATLKYSYQPAQQCHSLISFAENFFRQTPRAVVPLVKSDFLYWTTRVLGTVLLLSPIPVLLAKPPVKNVYESHVRFSLLLLSGFLLLPLFYTNYFVMVLPILWTAFVVGPWQSNRNFTLAIVAFFVYLTMTVSYGDMNHGEYEPLFWWQFRFVTLFILWLALYWETFRLARSKSNPTAIPVAQTKVELI